MFYEITLVSTIVIGIAFAMLLLTEEQFRRKVNVKAIKLHYPINYQKAMVEELASTSDITKNDFISVVLTVVTVVLNSVLLVYGKEAMGSFLYYLLVLLFVIHGILGATVILYLLLVLSEYKHRLRRLPALSDYMTSAQCELLFWLNDDEEWFQESSFNDGFFHRPILNPDKMVSFFEKRKELDKYVELKKKLTTHAYEFKDNMSHKQLAKHESLITELKEKMKDYRHLSNDLEKAVNKKLYEDRRKESLEGTSTYREFDVIQEELAKELELLDEEVSDVKLKESNSADELVLAELKRVVDSDSVSEHLKKEASKLLHSIEQKESETEWMKERESVDSEALAIINASRLFYRL